MLMAMTMSHEHHYTVGKNNNVKPVLCGYTIHICRVGALPTIYLRIVFNVKILLFLLTNGFFFN